MSCEDLIKAADLGSPRCRDVQDGWLIALPSIYSDGDVPQVVVRELDDEWVIDDFGQSEGRIFDRGLNFTESMAKTLDAIAERHRLTVVDGALTASCPKSGLAGVLARFSSALIQADALPILAPSDKTETFSDRVVRWLGELDVPHRPRADLPAGGRKHRVTALAYRQATEDDPPTVIQAVDDLRGIEHAFWLFHSLSSHLPNERLLAVASDNAYARKADIQDLTEFGYVTHTAVPEVVSNWLRADDRARTSYTRELPQGRLS